MNFGDFFGTLARNIAKMQRRPMTGDNRGGFGMQRPDPGMSDAPEQGNWSQSSIPDNSGGDTPSGSMLEQIMKSGQQQQFPQQGQQPQIPDNNITTPPTTGVPATVPQTPVTQPPDATTRQYQNIQDLLNKDYSKKVDPNTGQVTYGKDYDKTHNWKDVLRGIGLGALQGGRNIDPRAGAFAQLGGILGGAAGGGVAAGVDRNADNRMMDQLKLGQMVPQYEQSYGLQQQRAADVLKQQLGQAQIAHLKDETATKQEEDQLKMRTAWYKTHRAFDPASATAADRRQLAAFGETPESIGSYNTTNPKFVKMGGTAYVWNPKTNALEDSGAHDPTQAVVEYTVTDPNTGVQSTYATTSKDAAGLKTKLAAAGMNILAANTRQANQQTFIAGQNALNRGQQATIAAAKMRFQSALAQYKTAAQQQTFINNAKQGFIKSYRTANNGAMPSEDQINGYINDMMATEDTTPDENQQ